MNKCISGNISTNSQDIVTNLIWLIELSGSLPDSIHNVLLILEHMTRYYGTYLIFTIWDNDYSY